MSSNRLSRSVYAGNLRRAFLLRVHPDRFRSHDASIRKKQATLLSELGERMMEPDFQNYTTNQSHHTTLLKRQSKHLLPYFLENRDGSLVRQTLNMNDTPYDILRSMVQALKVSGAASMPPPPLPPTTTSSNPDPQHSLWTSPLVSKATAPGIDHQFDVNTNRGRNLEEFLQSVDPSEIHARRAARMDVSAAALVARRLYSFQAIDGTQLGWSSASFAKLLQSLIQLHEEHLERFQVDSFYPLRLVFSPDDHYLLSPHQRTTSSSSSALDVYSGILHLNPALTQNQWLSVLQAVTPDCLARVQHHRSVLGHKSALVRNELGVRLTKGWSCTSRDYHDFVGRLAACVSESSSTLPDINQNDGAAATIESISSLELERLLVVVESPLYSRRSKVTEEGAIRINAQMTIDQVRQSLQKWNASARETLEKDRADQEQCQAVIHQIQWQLGLQRVTRSGGLVSRANFLRALVRLCEQRTKLQDLIAVHHSLGIAGRGQFCHLGDDGTLIVPCDFS